MFFHKKNLSKIRVSWTNKFDFNCTMQCSKNSQFIICRSILECHLYEVDNDETGSVAISKKTEACIDCEAGDGQRCLPVHPGSEANLEKVKVRQTWGQGLENVFSIWHRIAPDQVESHRVSSQRLLSPGQCERWAFCKTEKIKLAKTRPWGTTLLWISLFLSFSV